MNNLWVVNPETDNVIVDAQDYIEAINKAEALHQIHVDEVIPHHKFFVHNAMAMILYDMAADEIGGIENKEQWAIEIFNVDSNTTVESLSSLCNPKGAILDALSQHAELCKHEKFFCLHPDNFFVTKVERTADATNDFQYQLQDLIDCLSTFKSLYEGIEENYESFEKEGQFKATK